MQALRILVVEDNPGDHLLVKSCLEDTDLKIAGISWARDLSEARKQIGGEAFSIILLDLFLGETNGLDTFRAVTQLAPDTPIIVLSGISDAETAINALTLGAQDYLVKGEYDERLLGKTIRYSIERKKNTEALRQSELHYKHLFETNPMPMWIYDPATLRFVMVNDAAIHNYGYSREEFLAMTIGDIRPPGDLPDLFDAISELKQDEPSYSGERRHVKKDGTIIFVDIISHHVRIEEQSLRLVLANDITQRKRALEAARFHANILSNISDSVIACDLEGKINYWNKGSEEVFGYSSGEMIGQTISALQVSDDGTDHLNVIEYLKEHSSFVAEARRRCKDGREIIVELKISYNYDTYNNITGLIGVSKDITDRKHEEKYLRLLESVITHMGDGVLITGAETLNGGRPHVVYVNKALTEITGYSIEELIGQEPSLLEGPATSASELARMREGMLQCKAVETELINYRKNGEEFWVNVLMVPVTDNHNQPTHFVFVQRDITARKTAEVQLMEQNVELKKTNAELDRFVYSVSHDLRSPLSSILGLINLFRLEKPQGESKIYLDKIEESINKLDRSIIKIVQYSRNSRLPVQHEEIDFEEVVKSAIEQHRYMDRQHRIEFITTIGGGMPFSSDRERLQVILNNLVANSIKYQRPHCEKPFVRVEVQVSPDKAKVSVSDNGEGIEEEQQEHIFGMFYRGTTSSDGSGLGLYIVKETLHNLGGTIAVRSKLNEGTTFTVEIPNFKQLQEEPAWQPGKS